MLSDKFNDKVSIGISTFLVYILNEKFDEIPYDC